MLARTKKKAGTRSERDDGALLEVPRREQEDRDEVDKKENNRHAPDDGDQQREGEAIEACDALLEAPALQRCAGVEGQLVVCGARRPASLTHC